MIDALPDWDHAVAALPPWPVAGPLAVGGLLLAFSQVLPRRVPDVTALLTTLGVVAACVAMAGASAAHPLNYWFGGWTPRGGQAIGIRFVVDPAGAWLAAFIGVLFTATLVFAWGYFDEVHAHFHVLMLLFMAGMVGFCLTHDLFNMFLWFELMSIAGFALTGYTLRRAALNGALNFTVVTTIGSYLVLSGIGIVYSRFGALDFSTLRERIGMGPADPLVMAGFALLACGMLIKSAQVPFHFWLADAHAVAPSPVSVIFSGAMVALGVFGLARLLWEVFAPSAPVMGTAHLLLSGLGAASALLGGATALAQRHIKRLLAFSTISHVGVMVMGVAALNQEATAGMLSYVVGHGLVKGALFMVAGILLAACGGIDEIALRGAGRRIWPVGVAMGVGGLLLAGLPVGLMHGGVARIAFGGASWVRWVILAADACTGAAVLRVTGRVFAGLGPDLGPNLGPNLGPEEQAPTEREREKADRPIWLMLTPAVLLLVAGLVAGLAHQADSVGRLAAARLMEQSQMAGMAAHGTWMAWLSVGLAVAMAAFSLRRSREGMVRRSREGVVRRSREGVVRRGALLVAAGLNRIHDGVIGDYLAWLTVGVALFGIVSALR